MTQYKQFRREERICCFSTIAAQIKIPLSRTSSVSTLVFFLKIICPMTVQRNTVSTNQTYERMKKHNANKVTKT